MDVTRWTSRLPGDLAGVRLPPLSIVAAVSENGVIGRENALPWRLKTDLQRFRRLTLGRPMIMGRRNFASIGRALPGRETIVLTRDPAFSAQGVHVAHDWEEATRLGEDLAARMTADEVAVVGGAEIYALALASARRLRLTRVHARSAGDVLFPEHDASTFRETWREAHPAGPDDEHPFTFIDLERVTTHP